MKIGQASVATQTPAKEHPSGPQWVHSEYNQERYLPDNPAGRVHTERNNQLDMLRKFAMTGRM